MKKLKDAAFGPLSFWVTDMLPVEEAGENPGWSFGHRRTIVGKAHPSRACVAYALQVHRITNNCTLVRPVAFATVPLAEAPELLELYGTGAWIIRGNLREGKQEAFARLNRAMEDVFQNRLVAFMVPDPMPSDATRADANTEDRPAFIILQREMAEPPPTAGWQIFFAAVVRRPRAIACGAQAPASRVGGPHRSLARPRPQLLLLTAASHFQLGVVANVTRLPPEALQALANPDNFNPDAPIPGMTEEDIVNFVLSAVPIAAFTFGSNMAHELGHRVAAAVRGVRLGASYFLPNGQLGSFGAITPIKSVTRNYDDLWDVAFAGPLAGGLVSLSLFLFGLAASAADASAGAEAAAALVPVPTPLFQGSLLLGGMCRAFLGDAAFTGTTVGLHPAAIAGWCGLVTTCLNLLPVGQTDGGRMAQATFGRNGLNLTSFFTYVGLALGVLGSSLGARLLAHLRTVPRPAVPRRRVHLAHPGLLHCARSSPLRPRRAHPAAQPRASRPGPSHAGGRREACRHGRGHRGEGRARATLRRCPPLEQALYARPSPLALRAAGRPPLPRNAV